MNHGADVQKLRELMNKNGYTLRTASIDLERATPNNADDEHHMIFKLLDPGINWAGTLIILIGDEIHSKGWVNWGIEQAQKLNIRVVGVYIRELKKEIPPLPEAFEYFGDALVGWFGNRIIDAVEGKINDFEKPDGSTFPNRWASITINC